MGPPIASNGVRDGIRSGQINNGAKDQSPTIAHEIHPCAKKNAGIRPPVGNASNCFLQVTGFRLSVTVMFVCPAAAAEVVLEKEFAKSLMRDERYKIATRIATGARYCRILPGAGMVAVAYVISQGRLFCGCGSGSCDEGRPLFLKAADAAAKVGHEIVSSVPPRPSRTRGASHPTRATTSGTHPGQSPITARLHQPAVGRSATTLQMRMHLSPSLLNSIYALCTK